MIQKSTFTFIFLLLSTSLSAQIIFEPVTDVQVVEENRILSLPFAGGLNAGQYNTIDLDLDGDLDLVVFDRSSDKIIAFLNSDNSYVYAPEFEYLFPEGIQNWMLLRDYNCDGKKDIFTFTNLGMRVFENTSNPSLSWELVQDPIFTQGTSSQINLAVNSTDIPAIEDLDNDGDLDILVYDFATGSFIEFHQNLSIENNGDCSSLEFERVTRQYGNFEECFCDEYAFDGAECLSGGRVLHVGGKAILPLDMDGDGDKELVIGQEECNDITILENKGNASSPFFDSFSNLFPLTIAALDFTTFPVAYYEDVNFDGLKDIIVAPNLRSNPNGTINHSMSSLLYSNSGTEQIPKFDFEQSDFLQGDMIDVGEFSYPVFMDVDGDLDEDLIIGNRGSTVNGNFVSTLILYSKSPDGLVLTDDNLWLLSELGLTFLNISFIDINGDQRLDLYGTGQDESENPVFFYILNSSQTSVSTFNPSDRVNMNASINVFDDAELHDVNDDGILDLLVGTTNGMLHHYSNSGTNLSPIYELQDNTYLGLDFSGSKSNLNITISDIDDDQSADLITTDRSGTTNIYSDFVNHSGDPVSQFVELPNFIENVSTRLGRISSPSIGNIGGRKVLVFGNIRGGITILGSDNSTTPNDSELELSVFPSPSMSDKVVKFFTSNNAVKLEIFNLTGSRILGPVDLRPSEILPLDLGIYKDGIYIARINNGDKIKSTKFVLSSVIDTP